MSAAEDRAKELVLKDMMRTGCGLASHELVGFAALHALCVCLGVIGVAACLLGIAEFWWVEWLTDGTVVVSGVATVCFSVVLFRAVSAKRAELVRSRYYEKTGASANGWSMGRWSD